MTIAAVILHVRTCHEQDYLQQNDIKKQAALAFQKDLQAHTAAAPAAGAAAAANTKPKAVVGAVAAGGAAYPKNLPKFLDASNAKLYMPTAKGVVLFADATERRWRAWYLSPEGTRLSTSASWDKYTEHNCLRQVLQWAWTRHQEQTGEECPWLYLWD